MQGMLYNMLYLGMAFLTPSAAVIQPNFVQRWNHANVAEWSEFFVMGMLCVCTFLRVCINSESPQV